MSNTVKHILLFRLGIIFLAVLISFFSAAQSGYSVEYEIKHANLSSLQYARLISNDSFAFFYYREEIDTLKEATVFSKKIIHHAAFTDKFSNLIYDQVNYPPGNQYIIKDSIENFEWLPQKGTKIILGYTCYAVKNKRVLVWYTKAFGEGKGFLLYGGLPGLPMQIKDKSRKRTTTATAINKGNYKLVLPQASIISREEHREILKKRFQ